MEYTVVREKSIKVIGIAVRTTNQNKRAMDDIAALWKRFEEEDIYEQIPNKISENILSIYTDYEYDFTRPYTYMIACPVANFDKVPEGMIARTIPTGNYMKFAAKGKMPDELLNTWNEIWKMQLPRSYRTDFEVYHVASRGKEFEDYAEIDVMIGSAR